MSYFLPISDLPSEFSYPPQLVRLIELGLVNIEPWEMLEDQVLIRRLAGLRERYEARHLVPFARRVDNDDVACFEVGAIGVVVIHDFAAPGSETVKQYLNVYDWFSDAIREMIDYDT